MVAVAPPQSNVPTGKKAKPGMKSGRRPKMSDNLPQIGAVTVNISRQPPKNHGLSVMRFNSPVTHVGRR